MRPYVEPARLPHALKRPLTAFRSVTATTRLLPGFLVIGAARSGTTSLYRYLTDHPCIAPALRKEIHFFDLQFARGSTWYRAQFPSRLYLRYTRARHGADALAGEASAYYMFHPWCPARVAATIPGVKLIALLRNPVDRAYSHYHLQVRKGREPLSFEEAVDGEEERLAGEQERMLADPGYASFNHRRYSYLARGRYAEQLERWMKLFPEDRLLVLRTEDLEEDPGKVLGQALRFLGVPDWAPARFAKHNRAAYPPMDGQTRRRLISYFEPHNRRLHELVGRDFRWDR
jgi:hypothetical protein